MEKMSLREYRPLTFRLWHWFNAFVIAALLLTVLLRKTLLSWKINSAVILTKLELAGHQITPELSADIAKTIRNPLWDWHIYLGYMLGVLLLVRILIAFVVEKKCIFLSVFKSIRSKKIIQAQTRHYYLLKAFYAVFHLMTLMMFITGIILVFKKNLNIDRSLLEIVKEVHEVSMWFFILFILAHLIGVILAENRGEAGIVSDMISGGTQEKK